MNAFLFCWVFITQMFNSNSYVVFDENWKFSSKEICYSTAVYLIGTKLKFNITVSMKFWKRWRTIDWDIFSNEINEILSNQNWSLVFNEDDPSKAYNNFISEFFRTYEVCFPLKIIKPKQLNKYYSPWLSCGLLH